MPENKKPEDERIVFFDVETGGLDPQKHPVIQFAAVVVDGLLQELESLELKILFNPAQAEAEALAVNHYDAEVWAREGVRESLALLQIAELMRRNATVAKVSKKNRPYDVARLCAHNARFDSEFIAAWFKREGLFLPAACYESLCTLNLARWASLGSATAPADHKLGSLCAWLGIELGAGAHDALADVRATVEVARVLTARMGISLFAGGA